MTPDERDQTPATSTDGWREPQWTTDGSSTCRGCGCYDDCMCNEWMFE